MSKPPKCHEASTERSKFANPIEWLMSQSLSTLSQSLPTLSRFPSTLSQSLKEVPKVANPIEWLLYVPTSDKSSSLQSSDELPDDTRRILLHNFNNSFYTREDRFYDDPLHDKRHNFYASYVKAGIRDKSVEGTKKPCLAQHIHDNGREDDLNDPVACARGRQRKMLCVRIRDMGDGYFTLCFYQVGPSPSADAWRSYTFWLCRG